MKLHIVPWRKAVASSSIIKTSTRMASKLPAGTVCLSQLRVWK